MIPRKNLESAKKGYKIPEMVGIYSWRIGCPKFVLFCAFSVALSALPVSAQKGGAPPSGSGGSRGTPGSAPVGRVYFPPIEPVPEPTAEPGVMVPTPEPLPKPVVVQDEACLPWDLPSVSADTVSAVRLGVPGKARSQYQKACSALKKNKLAEAEQHARAAIQQYPKYSAAWVMLGELLESQQKLSEAHDACAQPIKADPTYLPPYLCLAGLLTRQKEWNVLVTLSDQFQGFNPAGDMYSNYYRGLSLFHLQKYAEAQKSVVAALANDTEHHQPGLYFLLAQIYGNQGDLADATAQIEQFVKYSASPQDKEEAKEYLSQLQLQENLK